MLAMYPGGISECEIFFPYGGCTTASKVGQLAANHFASVVPDDDWEDRLREVGPALPVGGRAADPDHRGRGLIDGRAA